MNNRQADNATVEQRIKTAVDHAVPDVKEAILSGCTDGQEKVIPLETARKRRGKWTALTCAAAAVAVIAGSVFGVSRYIAGGRAEAVVAIDVNPSVQMTVNSRDRVVEATALNKDAAAILDGMDLKNTDLNVAVNALLGSMVKHGYIGDAANSVLVTVETADSERSAALERDITTAIQQLLGSHAIEGAVLSQTLEETKELDALAQSNHISAGKAAMINKIIAGNPHLTFDDLAGLSINELNLLASKGELPGIASSGHASDKAYIGGEAARKAALAHAGVQEEAASGFEVEMDREEGRMVYEVEFRAGALQYEYDIDAVTGEVVKAEKEPDNYDDDDDRPAGTTSATASGSRTTTGGASDIGETRAKELALARAGVSADKAQALRVERDEDDGVPLYEVKFWQGNVEYEVDIHRLTGKVLHYEREEKTTGGSRTAATGALLTGEQARDKVFARAGITAGQAAQVKVEADTEDGAPVFEVEFRVGNTEVEALVDAVTGRILEWKEETDD